jgi:hypothetical protein
MERGVGIVSHAEQEDLAVAFIHPADGAFGNMGRKR